MSTNLNRHGRGRFAPGTALAGLFIVFVAFVLARACSNPPTALGADAPPESFSGTRALERLRTIEGEGHPHPVGSAEAARVRAFLIAELERLGWKVEVQSRLAIGRNGMIAIVRNVIATLPGKQSGKCVMLAAHYDSVSAGPGTSDDGAGTASILEIARALRSGDAHVFENEIVLLFDEGEEAGLIGAAAFVDAHPLASRIGAVVNFEARGTCGPAHMFETSEDNAWLLAHYARVVPHPSAVSVAYELYKRMPNDTDLSVFKLRGMSGLNFAFIGGVQRYHTPLDDVAHLDPRSLQQMGESGLALARSLGDADLEHHGAGNAMYCDVLGLFVLRWPESWCVWLSIASLIVLAVRARSARAKPLVVGLLAAVATLVAATLFAHAVAYMLAARNGIDAPWSAHPWAERVAVLLGSLAAGLGAGRYVLRRGSRVAEARAAAHLFVAGLALLAAICVPSASYLVLIPALVAAIAAVRVIWLRPRKSAFLPRRRRPGGIALLCTLAASALLTAPLLIGLEEGFGFRIGAALGAPVAIVALLLAPAFLHGGSRAIWTLFAASCAAFVVALFVPAYDADSPSMLNLARVTDARAHTAQWCALPYGAPLPDSVSKAGGFTQRREAPIPWWPRFSSAFVAPAEPSQAAPPRLDVLREATEGTKRIVAAHLSSPRGALRLALRVPERGRLSAVTWKDQRLDVGIEHGVVPFTGIGAEGLELEFEIDGAAPVDVDLIDATPLTAEAARPLLDSRPGNSVPRSEGDTDVIAERVRL